MAADVVASSPLMAPELLLLGSTPSRWIIHRTWDCHRPGAEAGPILATVQAPARLRLRGTFTNQSGQILFCASQCASSHSPCTAVVVEHHANECYLKAKVVPQGCQRTLRFTTLIKQEDARNLPLGSRVPAFDDLTAHERTSIVCVYMICLHGYPPCLLTAPRNRRYALHHGYDFKAFRHPSSLSARYALKSAQPLWDKMHAAWALLFDVGYHFVFHIDADALVSHPPSPILPLPLSLIQSHLKCLTLSSTRNCVNSIPRLQVLSWRMAVLDVVRMHGRPAAHSISPPANQPWVRRGNAALAFGLSAVAQPSPQPQLP